MDCASSSINPISRDLSLQPSGASQTSVITYKKGEVKTRLLVPTEKSENGGMLGKGASGAVYIHRGNHQLVVKKSIHDLTHEFELGHRLSHRCIAKAETLFIKIYESGLKKFKLVIERIEGNILDSFLENKVPRLSHETALQLLQDAKETVGYLFDNKVVWADLQQENIFVTPQGHLKLCDLENWWWEKNSTIRAQKLLLGAIELVFWIHRSTSEDTLLWGDSVDWKKEPDITKKLNGGNYVEKRRALERYFDCVIEKFR